MDLNIEFPDEADIKIADGTQCVVTAVPGKEGDIITHRKTKTGKDVLSIQFKVAQGEHKNKRASLSLWPDPTSWSFRAQVSALLGVELGGKKLDLMKELNNALDESSYLVKLFVDDQGYTVVKYIDEKVERVDVEMTAPSAPNNTLIIDDEDDDEVMF